MFLSTGIASPFLGIGTFVFLWILQRQRAPIDSSETDPRIRHALILAAVTATVAPVAWTILFGEFFLWQAVTVREPTDVTDTLKTLP